jgi:hypothetical protein
MATSDYGVVSFDDSDTRRDEMHSTIEQWIGDLVDSVDDVQASAEFQEWLDVQRQFHDYSYRNTLLIKQQCPEASRVAGYRTWQDEFDRLPVVAGFRTPPVDLVGTRCAENFHPRRPVRQVTPMFFVDVEIPGRVGIEAGKDRFLVATVLLRLLEFHLSVTVLAEHALEGDMAEHLVPADGTPEELEQCFAVTVDDVQTHL